MIVLMHKQPLHNKCTCPDRNDKGRQNVYAMSLNLPFENQANSTGNTNSVKNVAVTNRRVTPFWL